MKWGGRKPSTPSSKPSFTSRFSWLFKFKHMRLISSEPKPVKLKKLNSSPSLGRFYEDNDENFWRLSFTEDKESHHDQHYKTEDDEGILKPTSVLHSFEEELKLERLNVKRNGTRKQGKDKVKEKERKVSMQMIEECNNNNIREKELGFLRRRYDRKVQSVLQEKLLKLEKASEETEKDVTQFESPRSICTPRTHFRRSGREAFEKKQSEELKAKIDHKPTKLSSVNVSREIHRRKPKKQGPKVRVHSPKMASKVEICKIKAIEDMKKARMKMKKEEEIVVEEKPGLDHSFAVVKCSMDPQRDFRDSMIEMIMEKKINKAEEMEELLACYLTLNSIEYHDLIIKVFKQVWLYMSQASMYAKSNKQCCCYD